MFPPNASPPLSTATSIGKPSPTGPDRPSTLRANFRPKSNTNYRLGVPDFSSGNGKCAERTRRDNLNPSLVCSSGEKTNSSPKPRARDGLTLFSGTLRTILGMCVRRSIGCIGTASGNQIARPLILRLGNGEKQRTPTSKSTQTESCERSSRWFDVYAVRQRIEELITSPDLGLR